ncbi:hypothetical protein L249_7865, partial [Ophiocordyceps polyrhachis-furcata BCC 54312]
MQDSLFEFRMPAQVYPPSYSTSERCTDNGSYTALLTHQLPTDLVWDDSLIKRRNLEVFPMQSRALYEHVKFIIIFSTILSSQLGLAASRSMPINRAAYKHPQTLAMKQPSVDQTLSPTHSLKDSSPTEQMLKTVLKQYFPGIDANRLNRSSEILEELLHSLDTGYPDCVPEKQCEAGVPLHPQGRQKNPSLTCSKCGWLSPACHAAIEEKKDSSMRRSDKILQEACQNFCNLHTSLHDTEYSNRGGTILICNIEVHVPLHCNIIIFFFIWQRPSMDISHASGSPVVRILPDVRVGTDPAPFPLALLTVSFQFTDLYFSYIQLLRGEKCFESISESGSLRLLYNFFDWSLNQKSRVQKNHMELRRHLRNETQSLKRVLKQKVREEWTASQAVDDIERQLQGVDFAQQATVTNVAVPSTTLEDQYRRRDSAIKTIMIYCDVEEGQIIHRPKALLPAQNPRHMALLSVFIKPKKERPRRCFICVAVLRGPCAALELAAPERPLSCVGRLVNCEVLSTEYPLILDYFPVSSRITEPQSWLTMRELLLLLTMLPVKHLFCSRVSFKFSSVVDTTKALMNVVIFLI